MAEADFAALQRAFTAHLRDPAHAPPPRGLEERRLEVYRGLVYRNLESLLAKAFPVLKEVLEGERWHQLVRDFLVAHRAGTPLFPRMPREFLDYLDAARAAPGDPPFVRELAAYEWLEAEVLFDAREPAAVIVDADTDLGRGRPVANPTLQLRAFAFPVHRIRPDFQPATPADEPTYLAVFRRRDDSVGFMELNAVAARLLQLVLDNDGASGRRLLEVVAGELAHPAPLQLIEHGLGLLADFHARDIVLGSLAANGD